MPLCRPAIESGEPVRAQVAIRNVNRTVGTILGHEVTKKYGGEGLPEGTIDLTFTGSAGQSFGAFVPRGITLRLEGDANDYLGKGLSGGRIVVRPDRAATFRADEQIIAGNVIVPVSVRARANITAGTLVEDLRPFGTNVASLPGSSRAAASSLDSDRPSI